MVVFEEEKKGQQITDNSIFYFFFFFLLLFLVPLICSFVCETAENLRIKDIEATEKKRLYDIAKRKENNKADSVAKKREQIKERAKILVKQRRDNAELAANESKGRLARMNKEKEELRSAQREL